MKLVRRRPPGGTQLIEIEVLAREAGLHPELVRRLVRLGLVEPVGGTARRRSSTAMPRRSWRARPACDAISASTTPARCWRASCWHASTNWRSGCAATSPGLNARGEDMDPNKLTQKTQEALHDAQTKALRYGHTEVDVEHLLLALLDQPEGLVPRLLAGMDVDAGAAARGARGAPRGTPARQRARRRAGRGLRLAHAVPAARRGRARGRAPEGRVRLRRARPARDDRVRHADAPPGACSHEHGVTRERFLEMLTQVRGASA